jgi:hypothetical protein
LKIKIQLVLALLFLVINNNATAQLKLFEPYKLNTVKIYLDSASVMDSLYTTLNTKYYNATFIYTDSIIADTVKNVGIRVRGNTSLNSQKKSYKISLDAFDTSLSYKKAKKLNFIGDHNDPTMARERLFYYCWNKLGMPPRRITHVNLYINNKYFGIYTNNEECDKQWLKKVFGSDSGNLYKCSWGADLTFKGNLPSNYSWLLGNNKAYDLQTNSGGNYMDLIQLIKTINAPSDSNYLKNLDTIFDYKNYLKALALDVATGNWDDYAYNNSNYLLWHDSSTNKFTFITIDTDNTFGVDWSGIDWTKRDPYKWQHPTDPRPLVTKLMGITASKKLYGHYIDTIMNSITHLDSLNKYIDTLRNMIAPYAPLDSFRTLDYGYNYIDFITGFSGTVDSHTPYGIKPFLDKRRKQTSPLEINYLSNFKYSIFPNPATQYAYITSNALANAELELINSVGNVIYKKNFITNTYIDASHFAKGLYIVKITTSDKEQLYSKLLVN